jgi:hypothetical protein
VAEPRFTDAHLERAFFSGLFDDTSIGALVDPRECACWHEALAEASAHSSAEYGQHFPNFDGCRKREKFAGGAVVLCCSNGELVSRALADRGFCNGALDRELLRRLEAAERAELKVKR